MERGDQNAQTGYRRFSCCLVPHPVWDLPQKRMSPSYRKSISLHIQRACLQATVQSVYNNTDTGEWVNA